MSRSVPSTSAAPGFRRRSRRGVVWTAVVLAVLAAGLWGAAQWKRESSRQQFRQGLAALAQGDLGTADRTIQSLQGRRGFEPHVHLLEAGRLAHLGNHATALYELDAIRSDGELRLPAQLLRGRCLYQLGRIAEAERVFRLVAFEQPDLPDAHRWLATLYHELGAMDACLNALKHVARLQPDDFFAYRLMGQVYKDDRGQFSTAIEHYRQALARRPPAEQRRQIARELAESLIAQREYVEALEVLSNAETDALSLAMQAECHHSLGRLKRAQGLLERARQLDPDLRAMLILEAQLHMDDRDAESALAPLQRILRRDPHDFPARYQLALAYQHLGDADLARQEMARVKESEALRNRLRELYKQAIQSPDDAEVREQIAELCDTLGQNRLATLWRRAAAICRRAKHL